MYRCLFPALWMAWVLYWWALSRHVKVTVRRESPVSRLLHIGPLVIAAFLVGAERVPFASLDERILHHLTYLGSPKFNNYSDFVIGPSFALRRVRRRRHMKKEPAAVTWIGAVLRALWIATVVAFARSAGVTL